LEKRRREEQGRVEGKNRKDRVREFRSSDFSSCILECLRFALSTTYDLERMLAKSTLSLGRILS
jgi:hypothetical protein